MDAVHDEKKKVFSFMLHDSHLELLYLFFKAREIQICTEFRDVVAFILGFIYIYI